MISSSQNEEMSSGIDEMEAELDAGGNANITGFSLCIAKIRKDCENFATIVKFHNPCEIFAMHIFSL